MDLYCVACSLGVMVVLGVFYYVLEDQTWFGGTLYFLLLFLLFFPQMSLKKKIFFPFLKFRKKVQSELDV